MNYFACILFFLYSTCAFSQSRFAVSDSLFNAVVVTDSLKAKKELEFQRTLIKTAQNKQQYLLNKAWYAYFRNRFDESEKYLKAGLKVKGNSTPAFEADRIKLQSLIATRRNQFAESNKIIDDFLNQKGSVSQAVRADFNLTACHNYISLGEYEKAKHRALASYAILKKKQSYLKNNVKIKIYSSLYNVYYYQAKYDSALYYLYRSEPLLKNGSEAKASFYDQIAIVYTITEKHRNAIHYYKKSIAIHEKTRALITLCHSYYNLGESYKEVNLDSAIVYYDKAIKTSREAKYDQITGFAMQDLGDIYISQKNYKQAKELNEEALAIFQNMNFERGILHSKLTLGRLNLETKQYDQSLKVLHEALVIALKSEDVSDLVFCYEYLYKTYEGKAIINQLFGITGYTRKSSGN